MDAASAKSLIRNLLDRLETKDSRFELPGGVLTRKEVEALSRLAGGDLDEDPGSSAEPQAPAIIEARALPLALECLTAEVDEHTLMCVDFGTAYSKVAIWKDDDDAPIPLNLGGSTGLGLTVDSAIYINDGHVFFGPNALAKFRQDSDPARAAFLSPKEHLTHGHEEFESDRPGPEIDPTQTFRTKELLSLYLGYMTALANEPLRALGITKPVRRRFAAPGWGNAQIAHSSPHFDAVSGQLKRLLVDAEVLANTIPAEAWMNGLDVGSARKTLDDLAGVLDSQRQAVRFLEQPVLEAVAAATGVQDKLVNQRPQVVVIDVGAGTTDLGVFKYAVVEDAARVSPYKNGMRALRIAGNRLDDALIELAWNRLQLADDSQVKKMFVRRLRADVRDLKRDFMRDGRIHIEVEGFAPVDLDLDEFEAHAMVSSFVRQFESEVISALNGAGVGSKNFLESSEPNLAVFTGGGAGLPFLRRIFDRPIKLSNGEALFELRNPEPEWLELYTADVRAVFPQIAVSTGGCAPNLPDEKSAVMDTSTAHPRHLEPMYKV